MTEHPCPVCERGDVSLGRCTRCGVYVASGSETPVRSYRNFVGPYRQDQGRLTALGDYVATKEDKQ